MNISTPFQHSKWQRSTFSILFLFGIGQIDQKDGQREKQKEWGQLGQNGMLETNTQSGKGIAGGRLRGINLWDVQNWCWLFYLPKADRHKIDWAIQIDHLLRNNNPLHFLHYFDADYFQNPFPAEILGAMAANIVPFWSKYLDGNECEKWLNNDHSHPNSQFRQPKILIRSQCTQNWGRGRSLIGIWW